MSVSRDALLCKGGSCKQSIDITVTGMTGNLGALSGYARVI